MASTSQAKEKLAERMERLKKLHDLRNVARVDNHKATILEDERSKLPKNYESKARQAEWLIQDQKLREEAAAKGLQYERVKNLTTTALEADRIDKLKARKRNPDKGFSDYEAATARQYNRLIQNMPARDLVKYEQEKEEMSQALYGGDNPVLFGIKRDSKDAVDRMAKDVEEQIAKKKKYSRRRTHNEEETIDYINERNARLNRKLERFYGEYTKEIKQNLERGTAI